MFFKKKKHFFFTFSGNPRNTSGVSVVGSKAKSILSINGSHIKSSTVIQLNGSFLKYTFFFKSQTKKNGNGTYIRGGRLRIDNNGKIYKIILPINEKY